MHRLTFLLAGALLALPVASHAAPAQTPAPAPPIQKVPEVTTIFPDVPEDHWAAAAVHRLAVGGLIEGDTKGRFRGNDPITRYEFALIIARLIDRPAIIERPEFWNRASSQPNPTPAPEPATGEATPQQAPATQPK